MEQIAQRARKILPSLTLAVTAKGNQMKAEGIDVVSFGAGEPDFDTPDFIKSAAREALDKGLTKYTPFAGTAELRKAVCDKLRKENGLLYDPAQIVASNGAKHSLYNAVAATVNPGDEVLIPAPYWLTYPELVSLSGGVPVFMQTKAEDRFKISPLQLEKAITKKTKAIFLNNPNNPTGTVYSESEIMALAAVLEKTDIVVISDEIYEKLIYDGIRPYSVAAYSEKLKENTIVVNGMSKTYSMTGWRIGYTASGQAVAAAMANIQSHTASNPNSIAQHASAVALTDPRGEAFTAELAAAFDLRRNIMIETLETIETLSFVRPSGAFYVMVGIENMIGKSYQGRTVRSASDFSGLLLEYGHVVTIPCESFGANGFIRLSYACGEAAILKGLSRIKEFTHKLK